MPTAGAYQTAFVKRSVVVAGLLEVAAEHADKDKDGKVEHALPVDAWRFRVEEEPRRFLISSRKHGKVHLVCKNGSMLAEPDVTTRAGIDEVGRGALAGPVCVAAVVVADEAVLRRALTEACGRPPADSKRLSAAQREKAAAVIHRHCPVGLGWGSVAEITEQGIVMACTLAANRALQALPQLPVAVLADAGLKPSLSIPTEWFIKGDELHLPIMAASIVAKVARDQLMTELALSHSEYDWEQNKGYGTAAHLQAVERYGPCSEHRPTFLHRRPVSPVVR